MTLQTAADPWAQGDYHRVVGRFLAPVAEEVVAAVGVGPGASLLDVGCGTGNASLAAAARGATVTGLDLSPGLLQIARRNAEAAGRGITFVNGDAQQLGFPDDHFDAVVSVFATIFAPDVEKATRELVRVVRPGGRIAYTAWSEEGGMGGVIEGALPYFDPQPPREAATAMLRWADRDHVRGMLADLDLQIGSTTGVCRMAAPSARAWIDEQARYSPGLIAMLQKLRDDETRHNALTAMAKNLETVHDNDAMAFGYTRIEITKTG